MKTYLVGGAIRNQLLGLPVKDLDYVVVGSSDAEMISLGFKRVGIDFPVYLHPETGDEYALARRERSTGNGYNDFTVEFGPDVTIEEDLGRRDITANSIAQDIETDEYVDPFNGVTDIQSRIFHVVNSTAFEEDPVRILRLARFLAEYPAFSADYDTILAAMEGNIKHATAERVALELIKALKSAKPSQFFEFLAQIGQLDFWFPEVNNLRGVPQTFKYHMEGDAFVHTMMVLDAAAKHNESLEVRFGCLVHDFGKASTPADILPAHHGHEYRGVKLVKAFCDRLKLPNDLNRIGQKSAEFHTHVHNAKILNNKTFVKLYEAFKSNLNDTDIVGKVAFYDNSGKLPFTPYGDNAEFFANKIKAMTKAKLSNVLTPEKIKTTSIEQRKQTIHKLRLAVLREFDEAV
jgi:tRNA nucleotidyltransferase (CCA-adding enzyme)